MPEDVEPETPDQVEPLVLTSSRGYYTIGIGIDPGDWRNPGVDQIVREHARHWHATAQATSSCCTTAAATAARQSPALPRVIDGLRSEGFAIVPIRSCWALAAMSSCRRCPKASAASLLVVDAGFLALGAMNGVAADSLHRRPRARMPAARRPCLAGRRRAASAAGRRARVRFSVAVHRAGLQRSEGASIARSDRCSPRTARRFEIIVVDDGSSRQDVRARQRSCSATSRASAAFTRPMAARPRRSTSGCGRPMPTVVVALDADTLFEPDDRADAWLLTSPIRA